MIFNPPSGVTLSLNFEVVGNPQPENPKDNTIWVDTDTPITEYAFSNTNPLIQDIDHIDGASLGYGYYNDSGVLQPYTPANPERYTEEIIPVEHGKTYKWNYTLSSTNAMWLSIMEYKGDSFYQRLRPVSSVSGTSQSGTYTPSSGVTGVRVGWRTFPDVAWTMHFIEEVTIAEEGAVWFQTSSSSAVAFDALEKDNELQVYPTAAKQYVSGSWKDVDYLVYQNGVGNSFRKYLFKNGAFLPELNMDLYRNASISSGRLKLWSGSGYSTADDFAYTFARNKFDFTPYSKLHWRVQTDASPDFYPGTAIGIAPGGWTVSGSYHTWGNAAYSVTARTCTMQELVVDISNVNQSCHLMLGGYTRGYVESIWVD